MDAASFDTPGAEIAALRALLVERDAALAERDARLLNATRNSHRKRQRIPAGGGWWVRRRRLMRCFW